MRHEIDHAMAVQHRQCEHAAVPAQVLHPLQARDLVERVPLGAPELRLEPGAKGERRDAERGAGELLRTAQRFHPRGRRPWAFEAGRRFVQRDDRHAAMNERRGAGQAGHPGADDRDVEHRLAGVLAHRGPARRGQLQERELVGEARLEGCVVRQSSRCCGHPVIRRA
jgi:hypothetical protein